MMEFHMGDSVVHWTYGLGEIVNLEERTLADKKTLYYVVKIQESTVYVPVDDNAANRLRPPTSERGFKKLFAILSEPGKALPEDRLERKTQLREKLDSGKADAVCQVIRDLSSLEQTKHLNDDDKSSLRRAWNSLRGEWGFSLSVPLEQVEIDLNNLLMRPAENASI